jgi:hypothetical protein
VEYLYQALTNFLLHLLESRGERCLARELMRGYMILVFSLALPRWSSPDDITQLIYTTSKKKNKRLEYNINIIIIN